MSNRPPTRTGYPGARPGSAMRGVPPAGTAGFRPGTASRGVFQPPPGTARLATGVRPGTGARPGTGLITPNVVRSNIRTAGVPIKTASTPGPGRQVLDRSFYLKELRQKISELTTEIESLQKEYEQYQRSNSTAFQLERKCEALIKEVLDFRGQLADYNLLVDRLRTNSDLEPADLERTLAQLRAKNNEDRKAVDSVFLEKSAKESALREIEQQIFHHQQEAERLMNDMDPEKRELYYKLKDENTQLLIQLGELQSHQEELNEATRRLEEEMRSDPPRQRALALYDELHHLQTKKAELESEKAKALKSVPEEMDRLLQKVKTDNTDIAAMERRIAEIMDTITQYRDEIAGMEREVEDSKHDKETQFKERVREEQEMQEFMSSFEDRKRQTLDDITRVQHEIVELLERISAGIEGNTRSAARGAGGDGSQKSVNKLQDDLQAAAKELANLEQIEQKILAEKQTLTEKLSKMTQELKEFSNIDALRASSSSVHQKIAAEKHGMQHIKQVLAAHNAALQEVYQRKQKQLAASDIHTQLEALEKNLKNISSNNYHLREFIAAQGQESHYKPLVPETLALWQELNVLLIKQASAM